MDSMGMTIDAALVALAAGTITDEQIKATFERASWAGYELPYGGPKNQMEAYWRVLKGWPKAAPSPAYSPAFSSASERIAFERGQERALGLEEE